MIETNNEYSLISEVDAVSMEKPKLKLLIQIEQFNAMKHQLNFHFTLSILNIVTKYVRTSEMLKCILNVLE